MATGAGVPKRPGVGIAVFVTNPKHANCVLLGKRCGLVGGGMYQLPGGHLEFGETWETAACREVLEETGLHIKNVKFCTAVNSVQLDQNYHYVTVFMKGEVEDCDQNLPPQNMEPDKCEGWSWIQWLEVLEKGKLFWPLKDFVSLKINPLDY